MKLFALTALLFIMHGVKCHGTKYFMCQDGSLTNSSQVCDGVHDCPDGFDENREICARTKCSPNMFRCLYGACISKSARCDGKYQCFDKSDELFCKQHIKTCTSNEFQCLTEECIPKNKACDGIDDCLDKSDESIDYCNGVLCPKNTYHCKYGGCIDLDARCNGFRDCVDGSDESELMCKSLKCSKKECIKAYNKIACPPIISSRIIVKCKSDKKMHKGWLPCNKNVPTGTIAEYRCKPYYHPINYYHANNTYAICQPDGTWSREYLQCEPDCGKAEPVVAPLVVYGWNTEKGMWPWHATLYTLQEGNWKFWCGGSLISEKVIITAAHCTWTVTSDTMKVALGKYYVNFNSTQVFTQIIDVQNIIIQPLYQDVLGNYGSDIAIIILSKTVNFSPYVSPVCVDWELHDITEHLSNDSIGMIAGMGITEKDTFSKNLRATSLPVVSDEKCIESQASDFKKYITYTSFCAGWANGTGVCNGDSGGGLVFRKTTDASVWVLQGIVSVSPRRLGTLFCDPSHYTIFTKVGMYVDWIKNVLKKVHFADIPNDTTVENVAL